VDRAQERLERQRRRREGAEAERRAEEERKRLQARLQGDREEGADEGGEWSPEDYENSLEGLDMGPQQPKKRSSGPAALQNNYSLRLGVTGGFAVVGGTGLALGTVGLLKWMQGQNQWDSAVQLCSENPSSDFDIPKDGVSDCPYTDSVLTVPSEHALLFRENNLDPAKKKMVIGFSMAALGGAGAGTGWFLLDVGPSTAGFQVGGRW